MGSIFDYAGIIHVHSRYSDGSGDFPEIIEAAKQAGAQYLITADHNTLKPLEDGWEGWHGETLVLIGNEISTKAGHYLALNTNKNIWHQDRQAQPVIDEVINQGGLGFLAHPYSLKRPWTDWGVEGYTGLEVVNLEAMMWKSFRQPFSLFYLLRDLLKFKLFNFNIMQSLVNLRPSAELEQWDRLAKERKVVGIGSVDAHAALKMNDKVYSFPSYQESLPTVYTHLLLKNPLTGDVNRDKGQIYQALAQGHAYIAFDGLIPAKGFCFLARGEQDEEVLLGDELQLAGPVQLSATLPRGIEGLINLYQDGKLIKKIRGEELNYSTTTPGVYRIEVECYPKNLLGRCSSVAKPWIYSNPIYLT